jgi:hypothetical protein
VPILWIVVYCLIAVLALFVLTFRCEMLDEKQRCEKVAKALAKAAHPEVKDLPHHP